MSWPVTLVLALGGALGTVARYVVGLWAAPISRALPWGTVIINVAGSFLIGFVGTLTVTGGRYPLPESVRLFLMVGFCGGFTTFSSFSLQSFELLRSGDQLRALANIGLSVVLCLAAVAAGHGIAARLNDGVATIAQLDIERDG